MMRKIGLLVLATLLSLGTVPLSFADEPELPPAPAGWVEDPTSAISQEDAEEKVADARQHFDALTWEYYQLDQYENTKRCIDELIAAASQPGALPTLQTALVTLGIGIDNEPVEPWLVWTFYTQWGEATNDLEWALMGEEAMEALAGTPVPGNDPDLLAAHWRSLHKAATFTDHYYDAHQAHKLSATTAEASIINVLQSVGYYSQE